MTLLLTIVAPWGIWQCADFRLTRTVRGRTELVTDWSPKQATFKCTDGVFTLAYTGLAEARWFHRPTPRVNPPAQPDEVDRRDAARKGRLIIGTPVDWAIHKLSWETRTVDESLIHLREEASEAGTFRRGVTIFVAALCVRGQPGIVVISNGEWGSTPSRRFETVGRPIFAPQLFIDGDRCAVPQCEIDRIEAIIRRRPGHAADYFRLLANANRAAAEQSETVSRECYIEHVPLEGGTEGRLEPWGLDIPADAITPGYVHLGIPMNEFFGGVVDDARLRAADEEGAPVTRNEVGIDGGTHAATMPATATMRVCRTGGTNCARSGDGAAAGGAGCDGCEPEQPGRWLTHPLT